MKASKYIEIVSARKGQNLSATWERPMKVRKASGDISITKITKAVVRGGIDYDNMATVKEGREDGTKPEENNGLPWGEWAAFPFHITHKEQDYLRMYPASGINFTPNVTYVMDGKEVGMDIVEPLCLAGEFEKNKKTWYIRSTQDEDLFWNGTSWGEKKDGLKFKEAEKEGITLSDDSEWMKQPIECFTIKADNLTSINNWNSEE